MSSASKIELSNPLRGACTLTASYRMRPGVPNVQLALCVASRHGLRRIDVAPDFSSGRVSDEPCDGLSEND